MSSAKQLSVIHIRNINLWSHVGVLEKERIHGQSFLLDISLWLDLDEAAKLDDLKFSIDYSIVIKLIQKYSSEIKCFTIEHYSEKILDIIQSLYGKLPVKIHLKKCSPPVNGFNGDVSIERSRYTELCY